MTNVLPVAAPKVAKDLTNAQLQADAGSGAPMLAAPHPISNHKLLNRAQKATASSLPLATMLFLVLLLTSVQ